MAYFSGIRKLAYVAYEFLDDLIQFGRDFPQGSKVVLAVMLGEFVFISTYDRLGIPSSLVLPVMFGSLIAAAFAVDRI